MHPPPDSLRQDEKYNANEDALRIKMRALIRRIFKSEPEQINQTLRRYTKRYKIPAVAVILLLASGGIFYQVRHSTQYLATAYFNTHYQQLSQTMNATANSLQLGIAAYNKEDYEKARRYFQDFYLHHPYHSEAKKNIGLTYLAAKQYDQALQQFEELAQIKNLQSNPGLFLQAVTLMRRNQKGDKRKAKQLLQRVVDEKAEGSREAAEWLDKLKS